MAGRAESQPTPAIPVDPVPAIIDAFHSHAVVALGNVEFRGNEQSHGFQLELIRDPRFAAVVNDILVEFGNSRYQEIVDRFKLDTSFYKKYADASGYPILASARVSDAAVAIVRDQVNYMLANRPAIRDTMIAHGGRVVVKALDPSRQADLPS